MSPQSYYGFKWSSVGRCLSLEAPDLHVHTMAWPENPWWRPAPWQWSTHGERQHGCDSPDQKTGTGVQHLSLSLLHYGCAEPHIENGWFASAVYRPTSKRPPLCHNQGADRSLPWSAGGYLSQVVSTHYDPLLHNKMEQVLPAAFLGMVRSWGVCGRPSWKLHEYLWSFLLMISGEATLYLLTLAVQARR